MDFLSVIAVLIVLTLGSFAVAVAGARLRWAFAAASLALAASTAGSVHMLFAGSVILFDPSGRVAKAALFDGGRAIDMSRLPGGFYYGEPAGDVSARITCTDGRVVEFGYFTPGMPSFERLDGRLGC